MQFRHRYYAASLGRFLTRDPLALMMWFDLRGSRPGLRGVVAMYSFADQTPVHRNDPLGLYSLKDCSHDPRCQVIQLERKELKNYGVAKEILLAARCGLTVTGAILAPEPCLTKAVAGIALGSSCIAAIESVFSGDHWRYVKAGCIGERRFPTRTMTLPLAGAFLFSESSMFTPTDSGMLAISGGAVYQQDVKRYEQAIWRYPISVTIIENVDPRDWPAIYYDNATRSYRELEKSRTFELEAETKVVARSDTDSCEAAGVDPDATRRPGSPIWAGTHGSETL